MREYLAFAFLVGTAIASWVTAGYVFVTML